MHSLRSYNDDVAWGGRFSLDNPIDVCLILGHFTSTYIAYRHYVFTHTKQDRGQHYYRPSGTIPLCPFVWKCRNTWNTWDQAYLRWKCHLSNINTLYGRRLDFSHKNIQANPCQAFFLRFFSSFFSGIIINVSEYLSQRIHTNTHT